MRRAAATTLLACVAAAGCSSGSAPATSVAAVTASSPSSSVPQPLQTIIDHPDAPTDDTVEVFVCDVPLPTNDPIFGDLPLRLTLDPAVVAGQMEAGVRPYFEALSHGLYHPRFVAGQLLAMSTEETHDECAERALDASSPAATIVMVVATAEDIATESGGWGRPGTPCADVACPAETTRRALYVGASDFYAAAEPGNAGTKPLLDLVEHEIGHTLDLPHSGFLGVQYTSPLDVMSNSAAPREVQPDRIDAQDTLGINRLALGWMPESAVAVAEMGGGNYVLAPSTGAHGVRLLVLPIDDLQFLTVEYLPATGFDGFLSNGGVAIHLVDQRPQACGRASDAPPCTGVDRRQTVVVTDSDHLELINGAGDSIGYGVAPKRWTVVLRNDITASTRTAEVEVHATDG